MPALSKTLKFKVNTDSNKNPIVTTSVTYPPATKGDVTYYSEKEMGAGYYANGGLHTVMYVPWPEQPLTSAYIANNFRGSITMQATLASDPTADDWFDIPGTTDTFTSTAHDNVFHNFDGNYVWIRAKLTISLGVLQAIHYNH